MDIPGIGGYGVRQGKTTMARQLAAILAADVVGYSRMMELDEAGTIASLQRHREELINPKAAQYNGRIVKLMGDGVLMEFASVVEAVRFAVEVQSAMRHRNEGVPQDQQVVFRVGVNLGDVVVSDDDILGDGVNLAARLESHAAPGGVCISASAYEHLAGRIDLNVTDMGPVKFKNIGREIQVYSIAIDDKSDALATPVVAIRPTSKLGNLNKPRLYAPLIAVVVLIALGVAWWQPWATRHEPAKQTNMALALPDKPSIAVLPFDNISDDAEQEYFVDGMTDDLLTGLSRLTGLFVISRNTSFTYKGKAVKIREVSEELGVRYVLEGSVRRSNDKIRINVQLIDALSGYHVWAEKFDRNVEDVFALQDEIVGLIVASMAENLLPSLVPATTNETQFANAYDLFLQGKEHVLAGNPESLVKAIPLFEAAIEIDPDFSRAYAALAGVYWNIFDNSWSDRTGISTTDSGNLAKKYLALAMRQPVTHAYRISADIALWAGDFEKAFGDIAKALEADPNDADNHVRLAFTQIYSGQPKEAENSIRKAMRLNPHFDPSYQRGLGLALFHQERYEEAKLALENAMKRQPDYEYTYVGLMAVYGQLGLDKLAGQAHAKFNELRSNSEGGAYTVQQAGAWTPYRNAKDLVRFQEGLRKAGVPDEPNSGETDFESLVSKTAKGFAVKGVRTIALEEAKTLQSDGALFVDTRSSTSGYPTAHIPGAIWLDYKSKLTPENLADNASKDTVIVFYCDGNLCYKSAYACAKAVTWGYTNVLYFAGGYPAWEKAGLKSESQ